MARVLQDLAVCACFINPNLLTIPFCLQVYILPPLLTYDPVLLAGTFLL